MPRLPTIVREPASFGRQATALDFGAGQGLIERGRAIEDVGRAGEVVADAAWTARSHRAIAEASVELLDAAEEIQRDPNWRTYDQRLQAKQEEILGRYGKDLGPPAYQGEFERAIVPFAARTRFQLRSRAREMELDQSTADLDINGAASAQLASRLDPQRQEIVSSLFDRSLERAVATGTITAQDAVRRRQAYDETVSLSALRQSMRDDPRGTIDRLSDPDDPLTRGLSPERREAAYDHALRAEELRLRRIQAEVDRSDRLERRARDDRAREASKALTLKASPGGEGITTEDVMELSEDLTPDDFTEFMGVVGNGGTLRDNVSNPVLYSDLMRRSALGDSTAEVDAGKEYRAGKLNQADYNKVLDAAKLENRYSDQFRYLRQIGDIGTQQLDREDRFIINSRNAQVDRSFREFLAREQPPTQEEAWKFADQLKESNPLIDEVDIPLMILPPSPEFTVVQGNLISRDATMQKLIDAHASGTLTSEMFALQVRQLNRIDQAGGTIEAVAAKKKP